MVYTAFHLIRNLAEIDVFQGELYKMGTGNGSENEPQACPHSDAYTCTWYGSFMFTSRRSI